MNMQLQKEVIPIKNSQVVKKCAAPKSLGEKRCEIRGGGRCDNNSVAKILIMKIQVNLVPSLGGGHTNLPELSLLKFLPLNYYHSHFWLPSLISHLFSPRLFGAAYFFYSLNILLCEIPTKHPDTAN